MDLKVLGFNYINSSSSLRQGVKGNRVPYNAVSGGCGSYIVADPAQILVQVQDVASGVTNTVNMYSFFKSMLYEEDLRMSRKRAERMVKYYKNLGTFEADGWTDWPPIPDVYAVVS